MKRTAIALALSTLTVGTLAAAHTETAEVLSAVPYYERVSVPRQQCQDEAVPVRPRTVYREEVRRDEAAGIGPGTVLGAIIGGVIGHQFGNSSGGRDRGAAAGAVIGGIIGNQAERDINAERTVVHEEAQPRYRKVSRCQTVTEVRDEVRGYDVTYRYNGRDYRARLPHDPGRTLQVTVTVAPDLRSSGYTPAAPRYDRPGYNGERWN
jgi:uncharacterized protein YcfJ